MDNKPYTLRELEADDFFLVCTIITKIGVREVKALFASPAIQTLVTNALADKEGEEAKEAFEKLANEVGVSVMIDIAGMIMSHLPDCKNEIYSLLANLSGMKPDEIAKMKMPMFAKMVIDVIKQEGFKDFFTVVLESFS